MEKFAFAKNVRKIHHMSLMLVIIKRHVHNVAFKIVTMNIIKEEKTVNVLNAKLVFILKTDKCESCNDDKCIDFNVT